MPQPDPYMPWRTPGGGLSQPSMLMPGMGPLPNMLMEAGFGLIRGETPFAGGLGRFSPSDVMIQSYQSSAMKKIRDSEASKRDKEQLQNMLFNISLTAHGPNADRAKLQAAAQAAAGQISSIASSGSALAPFMIQAMEGMGVPVSKLMSGQVLGASALRSLQMQQGILSFPSGDEAVAIAETIQRRAGVGGVENFGFTRGLTYFQQGQIMESMAARGILADLPSGTAGDTKTMRAEAIATQLGGMNKVVSDLEKIFGQGQSIDALLTSLDRMTGGALQTMSAGRMQKLTRDVRRVALVTGMTTTQVADVVTSGTAQAMAAGLQGEVGANAALNALAGAAAGDQYVNQQYGQFFGRESLPVLAQKSIARAVRGMSSQFARVGGGVLQLSEIAAGRAGPRRAGETMTEYAARAGLGGELTGLLTRMESGQITADDRRLLSFEGVGELTRMFENEGLSGGTISRLITGESLRAQELSGTLLQGTTTIAQRQSIRERVLRSTQNDIGRMFGGADAALGGALFDLMINKGNMSAADAVRGDAARLAAMAGVSEDVIVSRAGEIASVYDSALARGGFGFTGLKGASGVLSDEAIAAEARKRVVGELMLRESDTLEAKGIGAQSAFGRILTDLTSQIKDGEMPASFKSTVEGVLGKVDEKDMQRIKQLAPLAQQLDEIANDRGLSEEERIRRRTEVTSAAWDKMSADDRAAFLEMTNRAESAARPVDVQLRDDVQKIREHLEGTKESSTGKETPVAEKRTTRSVDSSTGETKEESEEVSVGAQWGGGGF